ncbi:unnamed protein product, partial [Ectocarpus sp. 12 AP-2014]
IHNIVGSANPAWTARSVLPKTVPHHGSKRFACVLDVTRCVCWMLCGGSPEGLSSAKHPVQVVRCVCLEYPIDKVALTRLRRQAYFVSCFSCTSCPSVRMHTP